MKIKKFEPITQAVMTEEDWKEYFDLIDKLTGEKLK